MLTISQSEGFLVETNRVHSIAGPPRPVAHPEKIFRLNLATHTQAISIELLHGNEHRQAAFKGGLAGSVIGGIAIHFSGHCGPDAAVTRQ